MGRVPLKMVHAFSRIGLIPADLLSNFPTEAVRQCLILKRITSEPLAVYDEPRDGLERVLPGARTP